MVSVVDSATDLLETLSLHDALPIWHRRHGQRPAHRGVRAAADPRGTRRRGDERDRGGECLGRSEEHTSELQSRLQLECRLLLGNKKNTNSLIAVNKS